MAARKPAGQKQRSGGKWERITNKQQKRLVKAYDQWSARVRKDMASAADRGASRNGLTAILDRHIPELEATMLDITRKGIEQVVRAEAGSMAGLPPVRQVVQKQLSENNQLVSQALIPRIREKIVDSLTTGEYIDKEVLTASFMPLRSAAASYAGGAWVMIFVLQQALGRMREQGRRREGLDVEPVRWVLDKLADHCSGSGGYHGCKDLAGVYPRGWDSLPTVPAGQVTCRGNAVLPSNIIDSSNVELATRLNYSGPAVKLVTQSGIEIAITANHPVLTPKGWLCAKFLNEGDYVINSTFGKSPMVVIDDYHKDVPALIEKIWDTFSMVSGIYASPLSTIMADDFHGDGRFLNGDVEIVFPDSQLRNAINARPLQSVYDSSFGNGLLTTRPLTTDGSFMKVNGASLATAESFMVRSDLIRSLFGCHVQPFQSFSFATIPNMDSLSFECVGDSPTAYLQILRQLQEAFTRLVTLDKLVDVIKFDYSGHAYDLQTSTGYYLANIISQRQGIVLSNCRCHLEVKVDGKWQRGL